MPKTGPTLEDLPGDILHLILRELPDRQTLKAAVRASPAFYRAYSASRYGILLSILRNHHSGLVIESDAIAAVRSKGLCATKSRNRERILTLLFCRQMELYKPADVNEIVYLLRLHEVAVWFVQELCDTTTMINPCFVPKKTRAKQYPLKLSDEEKRRIFRGFYRLQIWSNLFRGAADQDDSGFS
jgi:hypothetical protein